MKKAFLLVAAVAFAAFMTTNLFAQEKDAPKGVNHVIWIGADGFGAHYTKWEELPNLAKMKENGSWTLHMRSVLPSVSAINWETMIVGAPSEMHGFRTWGSKEPDLQPIYKGENGRYPDIFSVLKAQKPDAKTAAAYDWDGIGYLFDKNAVDDNQCVKDTEAVLAAFLKQLEAKPTYAFAYFGEPDHLGHNIGWGTPEYQASLVNVDRCVGIILAKLEELGMKDDTIVYFTSDHGGSEKGHGEARMDHMEVPFVVCGPGIAVGEITDVVANFDCAATAAWLLGLQRPQAWRGLPTYSIAK
ncbi:MAG: alkaline phosphatase [Thermoguttaceae bacterium]